MSNRFPIDIATMDVPRTVQDQQTISKLYSIVLETGILPIESSFLSAPLPSLTLHADPDPLPLWKDQVDKVQIKLLSYEDIGRHVQIEELEPPIDPRPGSPLTV
jgi:hypothetical protein